MPKVELFQQEKVWSVEMGKKSYTVVETIHTNPDYVEMIISDETGEPVDTESELFDKIKELVREYEENR